jgi:hypothetical protein
LPAGVKYSFFVGNCEYSLFFVILSGAKDPDLIPHRLQGIVDKEQRAATEARRQDQKSEEEQILFAFCILPKAHYERLFKTQQPEAVRRRHPVFHPSSCSALYWPQ